MNSTLETRSLGGILSKTFKIYWRNFLGLMVIVVIPLTVLYALDYVLMTPVINTAEMEISSLPLFFVMLAIFLLVYALMGGALIHAVSEQSLGRTIGVGRAYGFAWRRLGAMIGAQFLAFLVVLVASIPVIIVAFFLIPLTLGFSFLLVAIPAIYFGVRWAFIVQAALLEGVDARAALSSSTDLVKGNWWRVFGILLVVGIIVGGVAFILELTVGRIPYAGSVIAGILPTPIVITAATLLYYDLRVRKQGYNLETMAGELGIADELSQKDMGPIIE